MVEKVIRQYLKFSTHDTIIEYAMCLNCYEEIARELSEESMSKLSGYLEANVKFEKRRQKLSSKEAPEIDDWLSHCIVKGTAKKELEEFQIVGQFDGKHLLRHDFPFIIGFEAINEMSELLSNKTIDTLNGFRDKFLSPDPALEDLLKPKLLLL